MEHISLPVRGIRLCRYARPRRGVSFSLTRDTAALSMPLHGGLHLPTGILPPPAMITLYRFGISLRAAPCSPIAATRKKSAALRGRPMASASPPQVMTKAYRSGKGYKSEMEYKKRDFSKTRVGQQLGNYR